MKISKKEKLLLVMLVALLLGVVYYQFIYTKQNEEIASLEAQRTEVQTRYNTLMDTINSLAERQAQIETYYTSIQNNSMPLYPTLIQEKLILEIDELMNNHSIEGNISFTPITAAVVEAFGNSATATPESSLQPSIDQYNNDTVSQTPNTESTGDEFTEESAGVITTSSATVEQIKISLSFNGTYENLKSFIGELETYDRRIVITNIALTPGLENLVTGSMSLELFAFPKFEGIDEEYLIWTLQNTYGKETPFSGIGASVGFNTIEDLGEELNAANDFVALVKSNTSELPTFMMGTALDATQSTYIKSYEKKVEAVTLTLTEKDGLYYYNYSTLTESYPANGDDAIFTPTSQINIEITSEERVTTDDVFSVRFNVVNQTDKTVNITIKNDDKDNPRIVVSGEGNPVNVTKK